MSDVVDVGQFGVRSRAHARVHVAMSLGRDFKRGLGGVPYVQENAHSHVGIEESVSDDVSRFRRSTGGGFRAC